MPNETTAWGRFIKAQAAMNNPVKTKAVKAGARSYNYEVLADVLEIVTEALHANGLALYQGTQEREDGTFVLRTGFADEEGAIILDTRPMDFPADPQAAGSKETYARRYALKTAFGLAGVDDDGEAAHRAATSPVRAAVSPSKAVSTDNPTKEASARGFAHMKALLDRCRQAGMDMQLVGSCVTEATGKKSTEFGVAEYAKACDVLEGLLKEADNG